MERPDQAQEADGQSNPVLARSWTEKTGVKHVHTKHFTGDLAAVSAQSCRPGGFGGIALYDVTDPRHPVLLGMLQNGVAGVYELWLQVRGDKAYVYQATIFEEAIQFLSGRQPGNPDFRVIDVSDPRTPQQVGSWGAWKELGIRPTAANGAFAFNLVHSMIGNESGDRVYLSYWDIGTVILDMTDPTDPRFIGRTSFAPRPGGQRALVVARPRRQHPDREPGGLQPGVLPGIEPGYGYARIFDISDESNPVELSQFRMPNQPAPPGRGPGDFTVHDPKVRGNTLYLSHYADGVVVVDIAQPERPRQIAQFVPPPTGDPFRFWFGGTPAPHVWGVWVEKDYVLASDINSGLWVFKVR